MFIAAPDCRRFERPWCGSASGQLEGRVRIAGQGAADGPGAVSRSSIFRKHSDLQSLE